VRARYFAIHLRTSHIDISNSSMLCLASTLLPPNKFAPTTHILHTHTHTYTHTHTHTHFLFLYLFPPLPFSLFASLSLFFVALTHAHPCTCIRLRTAISHHTFRISSTPPQLPFTAYANCESHVLCLSVLYIRTWTGISKNCEPMKCLLLTASVLLVWVYACWCVCV